MSEDLKHECGIVAVCDLRSPGRNIAPMVPAMLLDLQTRGQLAAGMTAYDPERPQILNTFKDNGSVTEVFRMSHPGKSTSILKQLSGTAAIGHTRYATTGRDDVRYAQPFERQDVRKWKWFAFAFNGTLANYRELRERLTHERGHHFSLDADTEIIQSALIEQLGGPERRDMLPVMQSLADQFDGAYGIVFLDAEGRLVVARDPLGIRPVSWALDDDIFAAANDTVALRNAGFSDVRELEPGQMAIIEGGQLRFERFATRPKRARCFFEWVYFSNVASEIDGLSVYGSRAAAGAKLAEQEDVAIDDDCIVVPVPDTAKAAADAFAFSLKVPCVEGIIRNRYVGRTFIEPTISRGATAKRKYTPLPAVLEGKRVFLLEDSVVRSTTLRTLVHELRSIGKAAEVHVRVACPPIISPCFYGIDMSTRAELFAPSHLKPGYQGSPSDEELASMAQAVGVDSIRYLEVGQLGETIGAPQDSFCLGCVSARYPTAAGARLSEADNDHPSGQAERRAFRRPT